MNVLFICNQNKHRSKTAELLFKDRFETRSAGLYNETPVTAQQIEWADTVIVMEEFQRKELVERFPQLSLSKQILCFNIPDVFHVNQPELVSLLKTKVDELLPFP